MNYYVLDANNNKVVAYSREQVLEILAQAINDGSLENITADAAFIENIKCCDSGVTHKFAFVTQARYNELKALGQLRDGVYYVITDDNFKEEIGEQLQEINEKLANAGGGSSPIPMVVTNGGTSSARVNNITETGVYLCVHGQNTSSTTSYYRGMSIITITDLTKSYQGQASYFEYLYNGSKREAVDSEYGFPNTKVYFFGANGNTYISGSYILECYQLFKF